MQKYNNDNSLKLKFNQTDQTKSNNIYTNEINIKNEYKIESNSELNIFT